MARLPGPPALREGCHAEALGEGGPLGQSEDWMKYVYILQSELHLQRYYVGVADDLRDRLRRPVSMEVKRARI